MLTKEQKIGKLLHDLDEYAKNVDFYNYGLPLFPSLHVESMKTIIQAFVDDLKEGDNTKDFDENQLNAYRAFLEAGIPDEWANAMADRVADDGWKYADQNCTNHLCNFTRWADTKEGSGFWMDVILAVAVEGVSAFSKFQCPK